MIENSIQISVLKRVGFKFWNFMCVKSKYFHAKSLGDFGRRLTNSPEANDAHCFFGEFD